MAATAAKAKTKSEEKLEQLDEDIEVLSPPLAVDRTLVSPVDGEERVYVQHELAFIPKTRFFRLLSGTIRLASEGDSGLIELVGEFFGEEDITQEGAAQMVSVIMRLVELSPDFLTDAFIHILSIPQNEVEWAVPALESLDDETAMGIIDVFIDQNGEAITDFFTKRLRKTGSRVGKIVEKVTEQA
jgi:hypothetical protein